jgi:hypothetical protein
MTLEQIRKRCGRSREHVAVAAGVSSGYVRLYEANPEALRNQNKRKSLDTVYGQMRQEVER